MESVQLVGLRCSIFFATSAVEQRDPNGAPILEQDEEIMHICKNTGLYLGDSDTPEGLGTVYVTNR